MRSQNFNNVIPYAIMSIIALIGISSILKGSIFIVNPGERGLIINLGKLQDELLMKVFILLFPMFLLAKK